MNESERYREPHTTPPPHSYGRKKELFPPILIQQCHLYLHRFSGKRNLRSHLEQYIREQNTRHRWKIREGLIKALLKVILEDVVERYGSSIVELPEDGWSKDDRKNSQAIRLLSSSTSSATAWTNTSQEPFICS